MGHGRDMSDGTALRVTRDVLGATERGYGAVPAETSVSRMSEDTMTRDGGGGGEKEKKGWFGRRHKDVPERERKVSGVSSRSYGGRTSPTGAFPFFFSFFLSGWVGFGWLMGRNRFVVFGDASCDAAESEPERVACGHAAGASGFEGRMFFG